MLIKDSGARSCRYLFIAGKLDICLEIIYNNDVCTARACGINQSGKIILLTKFCVKKPYVIAVMVLIIVVLGVVSVLNTDVDFLPDMDLPYVVVATVYAGQPAEIVESDVTAVLEQALGNMSAVQSVTSMSYDNVSVISLQLTSDSDVDAVADELQGRISSAGLPDSPYLQESMVIKANPNMLPTMSLSVSRKGESVPDSLEYFNSLADRIRAVDGVQDVIIQ